MLVGEFGGAVGTLASLGKDGLKVQAALMEELGLGQPEIAWHTVRDRIGEVACFLGLLTGTLGKISMDVKLLMQTEVAEVYEPFHEARGSSSTMPQKRNPISCLYIHSTVALVRQHVAALLEAAVADHERSTGPWEIEWISLPEIFLLTSGALAQTKLLVSGLEVDAERMRANLDLTKGMIVSEAVMMGLGPHLGRQRAHDLVYDICRKVAATGEPLVELLAQNAEIAKHLTRAELDRMCDLAGYLGLAGEMVDRVLAREPRALSAATRLRYVAAHSPVTTAPLTFRLVGARVIVVPKPGGNHDHAIACRRIRGGAGMRQFGVPHRHAGARLSVAPHHHDRAVRSRRSDRYARANPRRAHAAVARPGHRRRERDRCRVDDRCWPCRAGVARRPRSRWATGRASSAPARSTGRHTTCWRTSSRCHCSPSRRC